MSKLRSLLPLLFIGAPLFADSVSPDLPAPARLVTVRPLSMPEDCVRIVPEGTEGRTPQGFSRAPRACYLTRCGTQLVQETLKPPLCEDGVHYFMVQQMELADNGYTLLMTTRFLGNNAPVGSQPEVPAWSYICKFESETPFVFHIGGIVLRFTMGGKDGEVIERCERLELRSATPTATPWRCLYPEPEPQE